jgi:hypothetical protein
LILSALCFWLADTNDAGAQEVFRQLEYRCNDALSVNSQRLIGYSARVEVQQWRGLLDPNFRLQVATAILKDIAAQCMAKGVRATAIDVLFTSTGRREGGLILSTPNFVLRGWALAADQQWHFYNDTVAANIASEDAAVANMNRANEQRQQEALKQKQAAEENEKRKQAALADCGTAPTISGGPWFSSTYKTAATDMGRRPPPDGRFVCVKSIEYIGAAVNPFGGNAARAKFTGYDAFSFQPLSMVMDFPY